jgi:hypothetical protein
MTKYFLKHLAKNILQVVATFGILYSFTVVADKWFGVDPIWGMLAFLVFVFTYFLTERSWYQAKREKSDLNLGRKS